MRLNEYYSRVDKVLSRHTEDTKIDDALAEGHGLPCGPVNINFNRALREIQDALYDNKILLGVFDENGTGTENPEVIEEKEIDPNNLRRYFLAVKRGLRHERR